jgi:pentalenolactone synthase
MLALQQEAPITRVRAACEDAWLVTRYDEVRKLLTDRRLRLSDPNPERAAKPGASSTMMALMAGDDHATDAVEHPQADARDARAPVLQGPDAPDEDQDRAASGRPARPAGRQHPADRPGPRAVIPVAHHDDLRLAGRAAGRPAADRAVGEGTFDQSDDQHSASTWAPCCCCAIPPSAPSWQRIPSSPRLRSRRQCALALAATGPTRSYPATRTLTSPWATP